MSLTLGDVLYASFKAPVPEGDWARLVRAVAASDQSALHALYERSHRIVFTLIMRITANRETAEEITLDVFHDIWRRARDYDPASGTVLGWIMTLARARADHCQPFDGDLLKFDEQREALRQALAGLTPHERLAIETTFFAGLPHAEAAARIDQPLGTVIRSGLHKLRRAARGEEAAGPDEIGCGWSEVTCAYTVHALPAEEVETVITHITSCPSCHREMEGLRPLVDSFVCWPADILRPRASLQARLARRIKDETSGMHDWLSVPRWPGPEPAAVAPGIECTLLADDRERERVSMLVQFAPGAQYAAHTHAWNEECHILDGGLWIDGEVFSAGDYMHAEQGSRHTQIHSQTGCTCIVITSTADRLD